ncbi:L-ascorbate metabolism protein UlaG (beta-lactamase superfamily) [Archangium gephyra]|uniref:Beta-lactamase-like protein n=1 Tax=Archangium gephyra TaxID=48 RepID=A0AAC8Q0K0_9BACT|nr:MBL fold metallo-hydrolase [Archangium gephyra]AKI98742.1 Beta-lactamase-like protein [Archangium gephyra]REG30664.1 L-ascorbate metabolism protein UlaG (beta-lactamase superfamily) [Archangium gephyra]
MKSSNLLRNTALATSAILLAACSTPRASVSQDNAATAHARTVKVQQIRNATLKVEYAGTTFLVDPMLAKKGAYPGFEGTYNSHLRNPLVELPMPVNEVMKADAIIVTHTHLDHWDDAARQGLPKNLPIFAQNEEDAESIRKDGFTDVRVLTEDTVFNGTRLSKTGGQHGDDKMMMAELGKLLGKVSGVVFQRPGHKTVYVAGDTVWNRHVEEAIQKYQPEVIILNTGYARVLGHDGSIIMGKEDLYRAYQAAPKATVMGTHMESVNHATQSREELRDYIAEKGLNPQRVLVPTDGQAYSF